MIKFFSIVAVCSIVSLASADINSQSEDGDVVVMSLEQAIATALSNNTSLQIQRLNPLIKVKDEEVEKAVFDPKLTAGADTTLSKSHKASGSQRSAQDISARAGITKKLPTGTDLDLDLTLKRDQNTDTAKDNTRHTDSVGVEFKITQSLLNGKGREFNLANVRKAEINTQISKQQLRRYIETLIYNVTNSYWNLYLEQKKLKEYQESYELALDHEKEVEIFIENGKVAEIELATVKGEVSSRKEKLIKARGAIDKRRLSLLATLNYNDLTPDAWQTTINPTANPRKLYGQPDGVDSYVQVALLKRPELEEASLKIQREAVELIITENGLLPKLDFFILFGRTQYANSFRAGDKTRNHDHSVMLGLDFSYDIGQREDKAKHEQGLLQEQQERLAMSNLRDSINQEVRSSYIDCITNLESISAVAVTRELRRQSLETQKIKFELGNATNNDIANAQRDLLQSQIDYTEALVDYVKSRVKLHYLDGSLIERSGIEVN